MQKVNSAYSVFCCNHPSENFILAPAWDLPLQAGVTDCPLSKTGLRFAAASTVMELIARQGVSVGTISAVPLTC